KAEMVAASQQPGVSVAGLALANGLNANMLRRWIREHVDGANSSSDRPTISCGPSFVPVPMNDTPAQTCQLQLQGKTVSATLTLPVDALDRCVNLLQSILR